MSGKKHLFSRPKKITKGEEKAGKIQIEKEGAGLLGGVGGWKDSVKQTPGDCRERRRGRGTKNTVGD